MLEIFLNPLVLCGILYFVAREESEEWEKLFFVAFGILIAEIVLIKLLGTVLGFFVLVPVLLVDGAIVMYFCHLTIDKAGIVIGIFTVYRVAFYFLLQKVL